MAKRSIATPSSEVTELSVSGFCGTSDHADAAMHALERAHAINKLLGAAHDGFDISESAIIAGCLVADLIDKARAELCKLPQLVAGARHG